MNISVVIPVYKKIPDFIKNLKTNIEFLKDCEIIVVNDDPTESLASYLLDFKQIILIENKQNLGFAPTVNVGFAQVKNPYVLLLNSDVVLEDNTFKKALEHFKDKTVFAVSFAQKEKDGTLVGKNTIYWNNGFFQHSKSTNFNEGINGWAEGGSCLIDTNKFRYLNGFDEMYSPFYWEDIDLSYRAWKQGYNVLFDPTVVVEHHHESTIGSYFKKQLIIQIAYRNQLLFIWKNISNPGMLFSHLFYLKLFILKSIVKGNTPFLKGYFQALLQLPIVIKKRNSIRSIQSDHEILSKFS